MIDKKVTGVLAYIGPILWLVAFFAGDKEGAKQHMNQGLVLIIGEVVCGVLSSLSAFLFLFGILGSVLGIVILVFAIMGIISAINDDNRELPVIGQIKLMK